MKASAFSRLRTLVGLAAVLAAASARADAAYGDDDGALTYSPGEGDNAWSDTANWYYSLTDAAAGRAPESADSVVLTVPIAQAHPLTFPASAVTVKHFEIGCPRKGKSGDWHLRFPSGSSLTVNGESYWARNAGTVQATIESGATLTAKGELLLGRTGNSSAVITNRGTMVTYGTLTLGGFNGALGQIDVFGSLTVNGWIIIGKTQNSPGRLILHEGGTLSKPTTDVETRYFSIGETSVGELVLEDVYKPCSGELIALGAGKGGGPGAYRGTIVMRGKGGIDYSSGSGTIRAACGKNTYGEIAMSGTSAVNGTSGVHFYLGYGENSRGVLTMADSAAIDSAGDRDPHFGYGERSLATVSLSGATHVTSANEFDIAEGTASTATVAVAGTSYLQSSTYFRIGKGAGSVSRVTIGSNSYVRTGRSLALASGSGAQSVLRLEGGHLQLRPYEVDKGYESLVLGTSASNARFEGWGTVVTHTTTPKADTTTLGVYLDGGQVVADGAGTDRDLRLNNFTDVGRATDTGNASGSNGWYAVNHGRIVYPHARALARDGSFCVGDYYAKTTPDLVNACAVSLVGNSSGNYLHAALYAPDRTDVPAGIAVSGKDRILGIWRMGYCTGESGAATGDPKTFTTAELKFRYDAEAVGKGTRRAANYGIETYRYDGTEWRKAAAQENDTDSPIVTLGGITPYADASVPGYNIGWTAIVARYRAPGLVITIR